MEGLVVYQAAGLVDDDECENSPEIVRLASIICRGMRATCHSHVGDFMLVRTGGARRVSPTVSMTGLFTS